MHANFEEVKVIQVKNFDPHYPGTQYWGKSNQLVRDIGVAKLYSKDEKKDLIRDMNAVELSIESSNFALFSVPVLVTDARL